MFKRSLLLATAALAASFTSHSLFEHLTATMSFTASRDPRLAQADAAITAILGTLAVLSAAGVLPPRSSDGMMRDSR